MNTTQTLDVGKPDEGGQLLFFIECPDCDTRRGFRTGQTWMALTNAELRAVKWETTCEECGRKFRVVLGFGTTPQFWTTRPLEVKVGVPIIDDLGLQKQKGTC